MGMGVIVLTAVAVSLAIWGGVRLLRWIAFKVTEVKELRKAWKPDQEIELDLRWTSATDRFNLWVRKKRRRLFKRAGWKRVNIYAGGDVSLKPDQDPDPNFNWIPVEWIPGTFNQFKEYDLLSSLIKTYGKLDSYFNLRIDNYLEDIADYEPQEE